MYLQFSNLSLVLLICRYSGMPMLVVLLLELVVWKQADWPYSIIFRKKDTKELLYSSESYNLIVLGP